jgi:hypothetical protein
MGILISDFEIILERAKELHPAAKPRIVCETRGRSECHMFEMPVIRAVGTYFSLSELAMMRHSGVMP